MFDVVQHLRRFERQRVHKSITIISRKIKTLNFPKKRFKKKKKEKKKKCKRKDARIYARIYARYYARYSLIILQVFTHATRVSLLRFGSSFSFVFVRSMNY